MLTADNVKIPELQLFQNKSKSVEQKTIAGNLKKITHIS